MENWRNDNYYLDAVMRGSSLGKSIPPVFLGGMDAVRWRAFWAPCDCVIPDINTEVANITITITMNGRENMQQEMQQKTKDEYISIARNFIVERLEKRGKKITERGLRDALIACAPEYRPQYWRRLRRALATYQKAMGYSETAANIRKVVNPVTADGDISKVKPKQRRIKGVGADDEAALLAYFGERQDHQMVAIIKIVAATGIRPAELAGLVVRGTDVVIEGAKKSHEGMRGADRTQVFDDQTAGELAAQVKLVAGVDVGVMQDRLRAAGMKLWPRRKAVPTLYSWRHQMGSDLKASGMDRRKIAYLMGHQATSSVDVYGNRRTARGGRVLPRLPLAQSLAHIRVNHNEKASDGTYTRAAQPRRPQKPRAGTPFDRSAGDVGKVMRRLSEKSNNNNGFDRER